ncbi:MAG TPA: hypothetical protein VF765_18635 [Polyangiaceae bacterium]
MADRLILVFLGLGLSVVTACSKHPRPTGGWPDTSSDSGAAPMDAGSTGVDSGTSDASTTDAEATDGSPDDDVPCLPLLASSYDQSCAVDSDCINVGQVITCPATACAFCASATIGRKAAAQYMADFSRLTAGLPPDAGDAGDACSCLAVVKPCCLAGMCGQCNQ